MKNCLFIFLLFISGLQALGQRNYWQQQVNSSIDVKLNDKTHTLDAFLKMEYINNSPDTLTYLWMHVWPNAFKNDKTAFTQQQLENGETDFYFSEKKQRGYINRLDFRTDNNILRQEDHPLHIDIIKVHLHEPLYPGHKVNINTPFHVQLPENFSRGGHHGQTYQVTQWFPKPAVYDRNGWHPMPYLNQGEFYSEFGNYDVHITLPREYVVAATGELQDSVSAKLKTLHYRQENVHDFAWFAGKRYIVEQDTMKLTSGRIIKVSSYYFPLSKKTWENSISLMKRAVRYRSDVLGEYPFNTISAVEAKMGFAGGMEYPTITSIWETHSEQALDEVLEHEIGHNWLQGILATNERRYPWMDEGINTYYDDRYRQWLNEHGETYEKTGLIKKAPEDIPRYLINALAKEKNDQPVSTSSEDFTFLNYALISYNKTGFWMKELEKELGQPVFDSAMKTYYNLWKFKHPQPEDFRSVMNTVGGKDLSEIFALLDKKGAIPAFPSSKKIRPSFLYSARKSDSITYIHFSPMAGYNHYDKLQIGMLVHNFNLPSNNLTFFAAPLYALNSKRITGTAGINYSWFPDSRFKKIQAGVNGSTFSILDGKDSLGKKIFGYMHKLAPYVRFTFRNSSMRSNFERWIEFKTYLIGERGFDYSLNSQDGMYYPSKGKTETRYLNQITYNATSYRALYPYDAQLQAQQGAGFYRLNANARYFFNYSKGGGMQLRLFGAKFGYLGSVTSSRKYETFRYQPKLTGVRGSEDYTYSDYFIGRNEFEGFAGQQIMMRDGGLKLRTDQFQDLQGRSDNWVASINLNTTLPNKLFPIKLPVRIFLDAGTYSEAWKKESSGARFLYVAGLQFSFFKDLLNVYAPVIYSREFRDNLKTVPEENKFFKRISFSIDVHRFNLRRFTGNKFPF